MVLTAILVYSTNLCADCARVKHLLSRFHAPYIEHNILLDEDAYDDLLRLSPGRSRVPTLVMPDGTVLVEPDNATLYARLAGSDDLLEPE